MGMAPREEGETMEQLAVDMISLGTALFCIALMDKWSGKNEKYCAISGGLQFGVI
jgi:hypothetical protein